MIVMGLDISSVQLNACVLKDDLPPVLLERRLGKKSDPLIERLRCVPGAVSGLVNDAMSYEGAGLWAYPDWVVIEDPGSMRYPDLNRALFTTLGAITCSVPSECQIGWRMASEWRHDLGAKNTKAAGHAAVRVLGRMWHKNLTDEDGYDVDFSAYDEHQLDALGIALAWRAILAAQQLADTRKDAA